MRFRFIGIWFSPTIGRSDLCIKQPTKEYILSLMLQQTETADSCLENAGLPTAVIQEVLLKQGNSRQRVKSQYNMLPVNAASITPTSEPETAMFHKYYKFPILLFCGTVQGVRQPGKSKISFRSVPWQGQIPSYCTLADQITHCWDTISQSAVQGIVLLKPCWELTHMLFWDFTTVRREIILSLLKQQVLWSWKHFHSDKYLDTGPVFCYQVPTKSLG